MATKPDSEGTSGAELLRKAEEYVKNPTKMADFTKEREAKEKAAKEKSNPTKGQTGGQAQPAK